MAGLGHTPRSTPLDKPVRHTPGPPTGVHVARMPSCLICTECGCFYVPTSNAVCGNKIMKMLKETVL